MTGTGTGTNPTTAADFVGNVLPSGTVSFAAGETTKTISVFVAGDTAVEQNEGFTVTLSAPSAGAIIGTATATGAIQNDDAALAIAATAATKAEGHSGSTAFTFTVTRTGDTSVSHSADWSVAGTGRDPAVASDFVGSLTSLDITDASRQFFNPTNGHIYEYVPVGAITGSEARQQALSRVLGGTQGYLATITSQEELEFITSVIPNTGNLYLGGDKVAGTTARWVWGEGPENGLTFWDNGSTGAFAPWDPQYALVGPATPSLQDATILYLYAWFRPYISPS